MSVYRSELSPKLNNHYIGLRHGDTLQILQTAFEGRPASEQRALLHWETAELRGFG